jgi:hypothetical protein
MTEVASSLHGATIIRIVLPKPSVPSGDQHLASASRAHNPSARRTKTFVMLSMGVGEVAAERDEGAV